MTAGQLPADAHWTLNETQQADQDAMLLAKEMSSLKVKATAAAAVAGQIPVVHIPKAAVIEASSDDKENKSFNSNTCDTHTVFQSTRTSVSVPNPVSPEK
jgi:hypothetical protein